MAWIPRALVDWDFAAHGIWLVLSPDQLHAPAPADGTWSGSPPPRELAASEQRRVRPWSDKLSRELLEALQEWNSAGERLHRQQQDRVSADALVEFWAIAADLAGRVQRELGAEWEVLHGSPTGAWTWVRPPIRWR